MCFSIVINRLRGFRLHLDMVGVSSSSLLSPTKHLINQPLTSGFFMPLIFLYIFSVFSPFNYSISVSFLSAGDTPVSQSTPEKSTELSDNPAETLTGFGFSWPSV